MTFRVVALDSAPFQHLFGLSDAALAGAGVKAYRADRAPGFPCRVSLSDAEVGARVLLLNYEHLAVDTPYRSRHAIFVREGAVRAEPSIGELTPYLRGRLLSVRAFDGADMMSDADVVDGAAAEPVIARMLADPATSYLHVHSAKRGCYLARIERA